MRKIKILGLVVVFVLPLLFFSTIRSEGAADIAVVIIQCGGIPLGVTQVDIFAAGVTFIGCSRDGSDDPESFCDKGDSCSQCLAACIVEIDALSEDVLGVAVSGSTHKSAVMYTLFEEHAVH